MTTLPQNPSRVKNPGSTRRKDTPPLPDPAATRSFECDFLEYVHLEHLRASGLHDPLNSAHEAYAVILEELDEFKLEVWKKRSARDKQAMAEELIQIAAMCMRAFYDLSLNEEYEAEGGQA